MINRIIHLTNYYLKITFNDPVRLILILLWPSVDLLVWGFSAKYFLLIGNNVTFFHYVLSAFIYWNLVIKAQQEISSQLLMDVNSHNLLNFFISPLSYLEIYFSLVLSSLIKSIFMLFLLLIFSYVFYYFKLINFDLNSIGIITGLLFFGWILGLLSTGFVIRFRNKVSFFTYTLHFLFQPFSCVFYPRSILPGFFRLISFLCPPSYLFEGMREISINGKFNYENYYYAFILLVVYLLISILIFGALIKSAKKKGVLLRE